MLLFARSIILALLVLCGFLTEPCCGASANEILVIANRQVPESEEIAKYYMALRNIPENHLLLTSLTYKEVMDREEYENKLRVPLLKKLRQLQDEKIYAIVLIYGVPLKVRPPALNWTDKELLQRLKEEQQKLLTKTDGQTSNGAQLRELREQLKRILGTNKRAAVDSELALAKAPDYPLSGWIENPYFIGFQNRKNLLSKDDVMLVCRLDGPSPELVYRIIDDAASTEKKGLEGTAYFDARWPFPEKTGLKGYALYDASLHKAAKAVKSKIEVKLDSNNTLFAPGSCPNAALYSGWYSLGKYIDSFEWTKGAVGYHIASSECATLRSETSQGWCIQMLKHGAAATIGPVHEPYVQGFPLPELFFGALTERYMNLGESYLISLPFLSWQMVLVGDPLYTPFLPPTQ